MNLTSARVFGYIFFENTEISNENSLVMSVFEQWVNTYGLEHKSPPDSDSPDVHIYRLAEKQGFSISVFRIRRDIDVLETEWWNVADEASVLDFWKSCTDELENRLATIFSSIGSSRVYFAVSDNSSSDTVKTIVKCLKPAKWKSSVGQGFAEIPSAGHLHGIGNHEYLLLSPSQDYPDDFPARDFPVIESFIHKLEYQYKEQEDIETQITESKENIRKLIFAETLPKNIENHLIKIEIHYADFQKNTALLAKLKQTLDINILNLSNHLEKYAVPFSPMDKTPFTSAVVQADYIRSQLDFDLNYLWNFTEITAAHLRLIQLRIENRRVRGQQRLERWIAALGITIGVGQIAANVPSVWKIPQWLMQVGIMAVFAPLIFILLWLLGVLDTEKNK